MPPLIVVYTLVAALIIAFAGAALNVPVALSPIIHPLSLVKQRLLEQQAAGEWSNTLYLIYTANPLTGIIDAFQRTVLQGLPPDLDTLWPGMVLVALLLPFSYAYFKRAESYFADII